MIISNPKTREFLELNAPYWLGRLEKAETVDSLFDSKKDNGVYRTLGMTSTCLMGEIYGDTDLYEMCNDCDSLTMSWMLLVVARENYLDALDKLILHQIECHKKPELKIPELKIPIVV